MPSDDVIAAVRRKIFHPSKKDAPLKLLYSEERGWYFPTKEELFRQQCTVTNKLRKSEALMVGDGARTAPARMNSNASLKCLP